MDSRKCQTHKRLQAWIFAAVINDPTLIDSLGITHNDFIDPQYGMIVKGIQETGRVPASLKRWLKHEMEVEVGPEGVQRSILNRLRFFRELAEVEATEPLTAKFIRFEDLVKRRQER